MSLSLRRRLGITFVECPAYLWALWGLGNWVALHNRRERLIPAPDSGAGFACDWEWTSDLRACQLYKFLGRRLLAQALRRWPTELAGTPTRKGVAGAPKVSFIIGHRGPDKVPHLLATLRPILAQTEVPCEVIVVEQASKPVLYELPTGVRYLHTPLPEPELPYSRAWAFNVGARIAEGQILILHDNDLLAPCAYAAEAVRILESGYEAAYLGRFVFYLSEQHTEMVLKPEARPDALSPISVMQNFHGGSLAIRRDAYFRLGGFDESFIGWGGEDNEMFDRCRTVSLYPYGYLPFIHLHHAPQPTKANAASATAHLERRLAIPVALRTRELASRPLGLKEGPFPMPAMRATGSAPVEQETGSFVV